MIDDILALNNAHATELSLLDAARLNAMLDQAYHAPRIGALDGFMIAFDQNADYDSPNFLWFRDRYARFVYVDRLVIAAPHRGRGLARTLYAGLFRRAAADRHTLLTCEVNLIPPNAGSDALHASLGFTEAGRARLDDGKTVRYLTASVLRNGVLGTALSRVPPNGV